MRFINIESTDPAFNHALEEYYLRKTREEYFLLWQNSPCILLGKNQNAYAEIESDYVRRNGVAVIRRITGGGAVFNDLGNLNFAFIRNTDGDTEKVFASFETFTRPVIGLLRALGVPAELTGRNDITVNGRKISGNAQARFKSRILHHGTLLFSSSMAELAAALKTRPVKFQGKAVQSVSGRVANIRDYLKSDMTIKSFRAYLISELMKTDAAAEDYSPSREEAAEIGRLAEEKYRTWEWNFGKSPECRFKNVKRFPGGLLEAYFDLENGNLRNLRLYGDFFGQRDLSDVEGILEGARFERAEIERKLDSIPLNDYFTNISKDQLCELLWNIAGTDAGII